MILLYTVNEKFRNHFVRIYQSIVTWVFSFILFLIELKKKETYIYHSTYPLINNINNTWTEELEKYFFPILNWSIINYDIMYVITYI